MRSFNDSLIRIFPPRRSATLLMSTVLVVVLAVASPVGAFAPTSRQFLHERTALGFKKAPPHNVLQSVDFRPLAPVFQRQGTTILPYSPYLDSLEHRSEDEDENGKIIKRSLNVDELLERLTTAFPIFVLGSAITGYLKPETLLWVNKGNIVTAMLATVMWGTGLTLQKRDFTAVLDQKSDRLAIPLGVLCQFIIMPLTAFLVGKTLLLPAAAAPSKMQEALFLGLCLVGCSPGGTASNLVSLIAGANVALSVILTTCSTLAAVVMTPLLVKLLVGSTISVSGMAICVATAKVVLLPILAGMLFKAKAPRAARSVSRVTPFASVLLVSLICGGVVASSVPLLEQTAGSLFNFGSIGGAGVVAIPRAAALSGLGYWTSMHPAIAPVILGGLLLSSIGGSGSLLASSSTVSFPVVLSSVLFLHLIGFAVGYMIPKTLFPDKEKTARTISIEVGMQNSALAVVLARSIGAHPAAALPGALSATVHSCLGSLLAAYWRMRDS